MAGLGKKGSRWRRPVTGRGGADHGRSGCGCLVFPAVFLLLSVAALIFFYTASRNNLVSRAELFLEALEGGRAESAREMLADAGAPLEPLILLFADTEFGYEGIVSGRLTGLVSGRVDFRFRYRGARFTETLSLARRDGRWVVESVPAVDVFPGAYVLKEEARRLNLLWQGEKKQLALAAPHGLGMGMVVEVLALDGKAIAVDILEKRTLSRILRLAPGLLEGEREGPLPVRPDLPVYLSDLGDVRSGGRADLVMGRDRIDLYFSGGEVAAVVVRGRYTPEKIRVVLNDSTCRSLEHRRLRLGGGDAFAIEDRRNGARYTFAAGVLVTVEPDGAGVRVTPPAGQSLFFEGRIVAVPHAGSRIFIYNLERSGWGTNPPGYRGVLEIVNLGGSLVAVNELPLDQYLYSVVPSEMPATFGEEALKAQAVVARSYAVASILAGGYGFYGAHVEDSVMSQVYNNARENPQACAAVDATTGLVVWTGEAPADTRFFSTSWGYTAAIHEVWSDPGSGAFPGIPVPYLRSVSQAPGQEASLEGEEAVRAFLERTDWPAFDADSPFFRWRVEMTGKELAASISHNLAARHRAQPACVLTRDGENFFSREIPADPLGGLLDLRVVARGSGGSIMVLDIEGTSGTYRIIKEYNVRAVLRPGQYLPGGKPIVLHRRDGSKPAMTRESLLPSAFACFDLARDAGGRVTRVTIRGGGFGHGVGMSQYGARGMAARGFSHDAILAHFYPGTALKNIYR